MTDQAYPSPRSCQHTHDLILREVSGEYDKKVVLDSIDFSLSCGHRLAVLGPNGAGKSTLIKILAGLKSPARGEIIWQDKPLKKQSREIAYLPQTDNHQKEFPITVREVVAMGRYPHVGLWRPLSKADHAVIQRALETMEIADLSGRQIDALSGGQQQRVFIARALAQEAHVILLDEPFNGLDTESQLHLAVTLKHLSESGHLIISSHHQLETVEQIFDHALVIHTKQIAYGPTGEVMKRSDVQALFSCPHHSSPPHV